MKTQNKEAEHLRYSVFICGNNLSSWRKTITSVYLRVTNSAFVASTFANKALIEIVDKRKPLIMK